MSSGVQSKRNAVSRDLAALVGGGDFVKRFTFPLHEAGGL